MPSTESVRVPKPRTENVTVKESEEEVDEEEVDEDDEDDPDEDVDEDPEEDPEEELDEESDEDSKGGNTDSKEPENDNTKSSLKSVTPSISSDVAKLIEDQNQFGSEENVSNAPEQEDPGGTSGRKRRSRWCPVQETETGQSDGTSKRKKMRWDYSPSLGTIKLPDFMSNLEHELDPSTIRLKIQLIEINRKLQSSEIRDDRPAEERSPSPEPEYNNLGIRINTREVRLRKKLISEQRRIITKLTIISRNYKTPSKAEPTNLVEKIFVPEKEYPEYNFIGLIMGPRGSNQKKMEKETGAKIHLRGKGASNKKSDPSDNEDLHVLVEASNQQSLDAAVAVVKKLLVPVAERMNDIKRAQLQELAKLRGTYEENICYLCKERGHQRYACPHQESTFKALVCDMCGSFSHQTSECSLQATASRVSQPLQSNGVGFASNGISSKQLDEANLYVGYLPQSVDDNQLKELFSPFGKIIQSTVIRDRTSGLSKGYGFVKFEDPLDANAAVSRMNGFKIDGKLLAVRVAGQKPVPAPLPLANLPIHPVHEALRPNLPGQASGFFVPPASMLPQAQASISNNQSSYFPSSSVHVGHYNNLPNVGFSSIPPSSVSSTADSRMTSNFSSTSQFASQTTSSASATSSLSQFPGASISNSQSLYFPSSSAHLGNYSNLPRNEFLSIPPSSVSNTPETRIRRTFPSTSEFLGQITSSSLASNSLSQFPGDPDYRGSQFKSYFSL